MEVVEQTPTKLILRSDQYRAFKWPVITLAVCFVFIMGYSLYNFHELNVWVLCGLFYMASCALVGGTYLAFFAFTKTFWTFDKSEGRIFRHMHRVKFLCGM